MNEVQDMIDQCQETIERLAQEQMDRQWKSKTPIDIFLNLEREEEWTKRIFLLMKAKDALEQVLAEEDLA